MANQGNCIKCGRSIDELARVCPYCSWWQSQPVPAQQQQPVAAPVEPAAPNDPRRLYGVLGGIAFGLLLMVAFAIGAVFHGSTPAKAAQQPTQPSTSRVSVTLIPVTEGVPPPAAESPITAIQPQGTTTTPGSSDLTALPSDQYAAAAARMRASQQQATGKVVDPRSITGSPYAEPAPRPSRPRAVAALQTQPIPVFQPVPHVRVGREMTAQLGLLVGTDGRVHDIDIQRDAPGVMGPLVGMVQQWRFQPATQNGEPVSARFTVAVTFRP
jgi:hypothetical protein